MKAVFLSVLVAGQCLGQQPIGRMEAQDATVRGAVTLTGATAELQSGAEVATGDKAATLKLERGGSLRMCPGTSVQFTASPSGRELLIALSAGAIETDYDLAAGADVVLTPDFQLQLAGPGAFHYAIASSDSELCTSALAGASASVIVSETMGSGTYQVRPGDRLSFRQSTVAQPVAGNCGCPEAAVKSSPPELGFPEQQSQAAAQAMATGATPLAAPPIEGVAETTLNPGETITQVDVPLSFKGGDEATAPPVPAPYAPTELSRLPEIARPEVAPPPKPQKRRWFQRLGRTLARIFR